MTDYPVLRFNSRLGPHHLAYLLDSTRNGSGVLRNALDEQIKESDIDFEQLKQASRLIVEYSDEPRSELSKITETSDVFERAVQIAPSEEALETDALTGNAMQSYQRRQDDE
jgi:hypothetical protein